ncbi:PAS domain-containing protein [Natrarchaeobius sp. A-rgal3]|uniref:PAS domain-containing protein n=1 Tax=Natrarchaeobius versutus TaxID=1679078 RepID=UPI00350ED7CA
MIVTCPEIGPPKSAVCSPINVLVLAVDRAYLERVETILDDELLEVDTAGSTSDAFGRLGEVDCLVSEFDRTEPGGTSLLEALRHRDPDLPIVFLVDDHERATDVTDVDRHGHPSLVDTVVRPESVPQIERLGRRIHQLVQLRRFAALSKRSLEGIELLETPIAIVDPDGDLAFANRSFAVQFGHDRAELLGTRWRTLFTDETVERFDSSAVPTVEDGWRWTGECTGERSDGTTFTAPTTISKVDDGSLILSLLEREDAE